MSDLRHAVRRLRRRPGLVTVATLSLGLGIGGGATLFGVVSALLLQPLPVARPNEMAALFTSDFSGERYGATSYPDYLDFRDGCPAFSGLVAYAPQPMGLVSGGSAETIVGETVSGNYFDVLGVRPERGRGLLPSDDVAGAPPAAVLSHRLWQRLFGAEEGMVGREVLLGGRAFTVVGLAPEGFGGLLRGLRADAWVPMAARPLLRPSDSLDNRGSRSLFVVGRLRPGATLEQAQGQLDSIAGALARAHPVEWTDVRQASRLASLLPESEARLDPRVRLPFLGFTGVLGAVVVLALGVACSNLAALFLANAAERRHELALRLSLGASRVRLVGGFVIEGVLVALLGGAVGLLLAAWATDALRAFQPPLPVPVEVPVFLDGHVVGFVLGLALVVGAGLGLLPGLQASRPELLPALRDAAEAGPRRSRLRAAFVTAQVGLSVLLLVSGGLLLRSLRNAAALDPGFEARQGLAVSFDLTLSGYPEPLGRDLYERLAERAAALPGVTGVAWATSLPLSLDWVRRGVWVEGHHTRQGEDHEEAFSIVGPGFFETLGVPLARGRAFDRRDRLGAPGVAMVNEAFARRYWPGQEPLGKRLSVTGPDGALLEVVGVTRDGKYWTLGEDPRPFYYLPLLQQYEPAATLVLTTSGAPGGLMAPVRAEVRSLDPSLPVLSARTLAEHLGVSLLPSRVAGAALGLFGLLALGIACLGIAGLVAHAAVRRTREVGIRIALGAERADVLRQILGEGMRPVALGLGLGLALAAATTRFLASLLYRLDPLDPATFLTITTCFAAASLGAGYLPARRATRIDPVEALRHE